MTKRPAKPAPLRATVLLPAREIQALGAALLVVGLALPFWVIKERTRQAAAELDAATAPAAGPLRPELVRLPNGSPEHEIKVPFALAVTEVTQGQYRRVMGNLPQDASCSQPGDDPELPVVCVTWFEAIDYGNRLSALEKLEPCYRYNRGSEPIWDGPECPGYRLPTGAEWEHAAQAATHNRYAGTDADGELCRYANVAERRFACADGFTTAAPVGHFQPNAWFLYDMTGNVAEWVWDRNAAGQVLVKGGAWTAGPDAAGLARQDWREPAVRRPEVGFRIARSFRQDG